MAGTDDFFATLSLQEKHRKVEEANATLAKLQTEINKLTESRDMLVQQIAIADGELKKISKQHAKMTAEMVALRAERESMKSDMETVIAGIDAMRGALS
jgi:chromosome segregation ATPase